MTARHLAWLLSLAVHGAAAWLVVLVLVAVGQPISTDDLWWHLALGEAFAAHGPWLASDPLLFDAAASPQPNAWLADSFFYGVERTFGLTGLRIFHVATVAAILALAWSLLHRASARAWLASLGMSAFAVLCAYRFFQLRPHLFTILATLILFRLLFEQGRRPSGLRVAMAAVLLALWVNLHSGFGIGLMLVVAACVGLLVVDIARPAGGAPRHDARLPVLALAGGLALLATFLNPAGFEPHLAYFQAGVATPELHRVADEWASFTFFRWPLAALPPTPLVWGLVWLLFLATPLAAFRVIATARRSRTVAPSNEIDPALLGLAAASLLAMLLAVRFTWLGIFPLLLCAQAWRSFPALSARSVLLARGLAALAAVALVPGFVKAGDWPMISRALPTFWEGYAEPYRAAKHFGHATWWLADAGLEGRLFGDYSSGGFLGYWLAPRIQTSLNGSMNVPKKRMDAARFLRQRQGSHPDETFSVFLEGQEIDLFLGTGVPKRWLPYRPRTTTTTHLEREEGWLPVFRNVNSAVYLRRNDRNRANIEKVKAFYAKQGVPFDPVDGFVPDRAIRAAPDWALRNGLVPIDLESLRERARSGLPSERRSAMSRLASVYALLGLYDAAIALDRRFLRSRPESQLPRRRLVWSLLKAGRYEEASREAQQLSDASRENGLGGSIAEVAASALIDDPEIVSRRVALLPLFSPYQVRKIERGFWPPAARTKP